MIDGVMKELPEGQDILLYNDRTYVPFRFVAEEMGGTVSWNESERIVVISKPETVKEEVIVEKEVIVERIVYRDRETGAETTSALTELPVSSRKEGLRLRADKLMNVNTGPMGGGPIARLMVSLENESGRGNVRFIYSEAVLTADGVEYKTANAPTLAWDTRFFSGDIPNGEEYAGYFAFPRVDSKATQFTFKVPMEYQWDGRRVDFELRFRADLDD
jgi:hypothetical protein